VGINAGPCDDGDAGEAAGGGERQQPAAPKGSNEFCFWLCCRRSPRCCANQGAGWNPALLFPARLPQTCSAKPIYYNPVLQQVGHRQRATGGFPSSSPDAPCRPPAPFGGCSDVQFHTALADGCHREAASGSQQPPTPAREQLLIAEVHQECLEPLVAILGNNRGRKDALRGQA